MGTTASRVATARSAVRVSGHDISRIALASLASVSTVRRVLSGDQTASAASRTRVLDACRTLGIEVPPEALTGPTLTREIATK